ncbi:DUF6053 domain-containing protein [Lysobacter gummosus]|uniref:DUF6053 domain-containing protein n=1 Tax=Lysobacter gummosus TaxID=262324 RepID=UPI001C9D80BC
MLLAQIAVNGSKSIGAEAPPAKNPAAPVVCGLWPLRGGTRPARFPAAGVHPPPTKMTSP